MRQRETRLASAAILALAAACAPSAQAAYVVTFQEVGANVVESGGGTVDETDLKINNTDDSGFAFLTPSDGAFLSGSGAPAVFDVFIDITGPGVFGPGDVDVPNSSSGDAVGIQMGSSGFISLPVGYTSGSPLSETSTYLHATFGSLGLTPGAYVYTWGTGDHADSFTINIGASAVPEPSTWAMIILGFAGLGYASIRRKGAARAISA